MTTKKHTKLSLWVLAWPIMIEMLLQFMIGTADTLMVSRISDHAVAVVGISNQFFMSAIILFMMITSGAGVLIAQKIGAGQEQDARTVAVMTLQITFGLGIIVSAFLYFGAHLVSAWLQIPMELQPLAVTYISVVGSGTMFTSLMLALSTIIRNTGNTKSPMYISIGMNIVHVFFNYLFIFGALGFPQWGLYGVALSTVMSRGLAVIVLLYVLRSAFSEPIKRRDYNLFRWPLLKEVLRIGWPMSINGASWTFSQITIFALIASIGATELAARTYLNTLESFCFLLGMSLSMAGQIQIAQLYGAARLSETYETAWRVLRTGLAVVMVNTVLLVAFGRVILQWFTSDNDILVLGVSVLLMNLILQPAKMVCNTFISSLSAIGDTRFIAVVGVSSMWAVSVGLTYVFGISLHWGLLGIYAAMTLDEYVRGALYIMRWRQKRAMWGFGPWNGQNNATTSVRSEIET
ncbi:MATE family efflux transporter [Paenibacillus allorhizosphaerae]|uniref:FMN/FAD exporter YeeO n=1 Tax=Paenibacillus allorhizosphaerae TaxID=2849866 RepID=A0ABN7TA34_9BACL|nr:MATE family efflux transporter [Paenibacillus allorhizosphaerae]CAG7615433.1 putative FMN/FAD exporter YeeO [Paenibacillus allorhizosphaerae]